MSRAFISYARNDGMEIASEIYEKLQLHNLNPWRDTANLISGHPWDESIDDAIADSYAMIVVATDLAVVSAGVTYEWATAQALKNIRLILIFFPGKRDLLPKQINILHQLEWGTMDFWGKLINDLKQAQLEDQLINVRIPVEADAELKFIAKMAFSSIYSEEENLHAIDKLFDMDNDPFSREIIINGLNSRRQTIVDHILNRMKNSGFTDIRVIPSLLKLLFLPIEGNSKEQRRKEHLVHLAKVILVDFDDDTWDILYHHINNTDSSIEKIRSSELALIYNPRFVLPFICSWLNENDDHFFDTSIKIITGLISQYRATQSGIFTDLTIKYPSEIPNLIGEIVLPSIRDIINKKLKDSSFKDSLEKRKFQDLLIKIKSLPEVMQSANSILLSTM